MRIVALSFLLLGLLSEVLSAEEFPSYYGPINDVFPGYGHDSSSAAPEEPVQSPMAYGLFVSAFVADGLLADAKRGAGWLVEHDDLDQDGVPGWGLPFAWDAFNDGSINPTHTVYGITTAIVVQGLLDLYEATHEKRYLTPAVAALQAYGMQFDHGNMHYSVAPADETPVHNVTAMLMGQYKRAASLAGRADFSRLADKSYAYLMSQVHQSGGMIWWDYIPGKRGNDLVHAAYMVRGLIDYGAPDGVVDKARAHLHRFVRNGMVYDHIEEGSLPANVWGLGAAVQVACEVGDTGLRAAMEEALPLYLQEGSYTVRPGEGHYAPRLQSHVAWGLSSC